jgi:DNA recombination protein RmuC
LTEILIIIALLVCIAGVGIIIWRQNRRPAASGRDKVEELTRRNEELATERRVAEEKNTWLNEQLSTVTREVQQKDTTILDLNARISRRNAEYESLLTKLADQKTEIGKLQEQFRVEFKNLANEILEEKTRRFTEQNKVRLEEILKPFGEKIREFEKKVEEAYDKESKERFSLAKEIKNLSELNQKISQEASNLTSALKGQSKTQGNWGEIILESILEKSGLARDREYFIQQSFVNDHGRRLQPDVIVTYPGDRNVVIDSKVSLTAYERYASAGSKEDQDKALREHLLSVRNHVNELNSKNYQDLYELRSLDFVMMFMPVEPAYLIAMQGDPELWNYAYDRRVLLISPTNLIAALRMIANLWRVENQNRNALEIARQSGELLDKLAGFVEDLQDIGNRLEATRKSYDGALNKLSTGKGNILRRAEKIRQLGAKSGKELPRQLLERADEE